MIGSVYMGLGRSADGRARSSVACPKRLSRALVHKAPSILEYKSPTTHDMPDVEVMLIEDPEPNGPFGAKEVGQGPLLPIMPAVANAVFDAVGVRVDETPITPEKVVAGLADLAKGGDGRVGPKRFPEIEWPDPFVVPPPWEGGDGKSLTDPDRKRAARLVRDTVPQP